MKQLRLCMLGVSLLALWAPTVLHAQLIRLSAEYRRWDGLDDASFATPGSGGVNVYQKTVTVPPGKNVLFVTYSTTGISGISFTDMQLACTVDGANCTPGTTHSGGSPGWIAVQTGATFAVNEIEKQWCANITSSITAKPHTIRIDLASLDGFTSLFNEGTHVFIDTTKLTGGCTKSTTPP